MALPPLNGAVQVIVTKLPLLAEAGAAGAVGTHAQSTSTVLLYVNDKPNALRDYTLNWYWFPGVSDVAV
jgi:hypothetical protein